MPDRDESIDHDDHTVLFEIPGISKKSVNKCPICGSYINERDTKCPNCGYELKKDEDEEEDDLW